MTENSYFIKTTNSYIPSLSREQKYKLNRRGNELFNTGNIEAAKRIFSTTGYSDGLSRIGDYYYGQNKKIEALKYYTMAHSSSKADVIINDIVQIIRMCIKTELL